MDLQQIDEKYQPYIANIKKLIEEPIPKVLNPKLMLVVNHRLKYLTILLDKSAVIGDLASMVGLLVLEVQSIIRLHRRTSVGTMVVDRKLKQLTDQNNFMKEYVKLLKEKRDVINDLIAGLRTIGTNQNNYGL